MEKQFCETFNVNDDYREHYTSESQTGNPTFCNEFSKNHTFTKSKRSIIPDLDKYTFADDIKNRADLIYNLMHKQVRRKKVRDQLIFFCVYCAHLELMRDVNSTSLGSVFGLTQGEIQKCDSLFSFLQTGYKSPINNSSPCKYYPEYFNIIGLSDDLLEDINVLTRDIVVKDRTLSQENPETVAGGILKYFLVTRGIYVDDPDKIQNITKKSKQAIDSMYRRISIIDNS